MHTDLNTTANATDVSLATIFPRWADTGAIILGGGFRLPSARTADAGKVVLGGGFRLPGVRTADTGKVVLGGGFRLPAKG